MSKPSKEELDQLINPWKHLADFNYDDLIVKSLPCGFPSLDKYDLVKEDVGEMVIIAGTTSVGKSSFGIQMADAMSSQYPVLFLSLEMSRNEIITRLLSRYLETDPSTIKRGRYESMQELFETHKRLAERNLHIDDRGGLSVRAICDLIRVAKHKLGIKAVMLDHLGKIRRDKGHSVNAEVGDITAELHTTAKELKLPIIVMCQLNRGPANRGKETGNFTPMVSDLRDSGNIEQDADMVILLYRHDMYYKQERVGEADIIIAKNRNGPTGTVTLQFSKSQTRFIDA